MGILLWLLKGKKYAFRFVYLFKKKSCLLFCCQSSFSFCDILFYVETEVKKWALYSKKEYLKIDKKKLVIGFTVVGMLEIWKKKNDLSPPKFTLKRKLHTEKKSNQTLNNQYDRYSALFF